MPFDSLPVITLASKSYLLKNKGLKGALWRAHPRPVIPMISAYKRKFLKAIAVLFWAALWVCPLALWAAAGHPIAHPVHTRSTMVVSVNGRASEAGVAIMKHGGNAIEAAGATGFARAGVRPHAGRIDRHGSLLLFASPLLTAPVCSSASHPTP